MSILCSVMITGAHNAASHASWQVLRPSRAGQAGISYGGWGYADLCSDLHGGAYWFTPRGHCTMPHYRASAAIQEQWAEADVVTAPGSRSGTFGNVFSSRELDAPHGVARTLGRARPLSRHTAVTDVHSLMLCLRAFGEARRSCGPLDRRKTS
jgi:hypothetical protein